MSNNHLPQAFPVSMQMSPCMNIPPPELEVKLSQSISSYQESPALPLRSGSMSVNMDTTSLLGKRKPPVQPMFNGTAPPQMLPVQNKRMVPLEHGSCVSELNKGSVLMKQSSSVSRGTQYLPASFCKNAPASGKQTAARKQITQKVKPQNESFESVRSKMRESLAGALAMVQCRTEAPKESKRLHCETAANPLQGHVSEPVSAAASGIDAMVSNGTLTDPASVQTVLPEILTITRESDVKEVLAQEPQDVKRFLHDSFSYSDIVFSEDDLLQENDLSWALESDIEFTDGCQNEMIGAVANDGSQERSKEKMLLDPQVLAFKVEAELFRLFCGVNKKYKEKGRSLLFNLKDRNNPKLREKVMFGEIPAERLCSMSAEELASKELAEWRQAKAEEMAQMVVLQDTQVDIRNLVRKTHKGEFQVEVEPIDRGSVEVSVGMSSLNWSRPKNIKKKPPSITKPLGIKNELNDSNEGTGLINGVTIDDEMQAATGSLPPIVSLDEFMLSVDSESPSDSSSSDIVKRPHVSDNAEAVIILTSPKESANIDIGTSPVKAEITPVKVDTSPVKAENGDIVSLKPYSDFIPAGERVWEGALQLSASSVSSVIGILRSGEKTTTKEWPMLLEIKGRVRLDAFEKFVRELPNSRSRAVMVMCFVCKEECSKTEQENISEVVDTYSRDERVGYAEPASGVELYLCPTRGRTAEILKKIVPKNQLDLLKSLDDGLIGLVVWRRPQLKNQQVSNSHKNHREIGSFTTHNTSRYSNMVQVSHDDGGDVPPGFGPMAIAQDDDDLPEFNYCSGRNVVMNRTESVRELIHKYGKSEPLWNQQGFNDADNEILPEWQPKLIHQSVVSNNVNGGPMVRPRSDWWPHQAGGRY